MPASPASELKLLTAIAGLSAYLGQYATRKSAFPEHPRMSPLRARRLLDRMDAPDRALRVVHIVGTKGKGSTAALLESILSQAGWQTGLYTSPHLHSPRERIRVCGVPISRAAFCSGLHLLLPLLEESLSWPDLGPATLFEGLTALAMSYFHRRGVDVALVEAGMGGRSDATRALTPLLTLLTPIALDHQAYLGNTLEAIAAEKAGAIPAGGLAICAPQPAPAWAVIQAHCHQVGASLRRSEGPLPSGPALTGPHQLLNAQLAVSAVTALRKEGLVVPDTAVVAGLQMVHWPGRLEIAAGRPLVVVDAAHNPASAEALAAALAADFPQRPRLFLVGCSSDKDLAGIVDALAPMCDGAVVTKAQHHRAAEPAQLAALWQQHGVAVKVSPATDQALALARNWAGPAGLVCATGSIFIVAEVRETLGMAVREPWPDPVAGAPHSTPGPA